MTKSNNEEDNNDNKNEKRMRIEETRHFVASRSSPGRRHSALVHETVFFNLESSSGIDAVVAATVPYKSRLAPAMVSAHPWLVSRWHRSYRLQMNPFALSVL
jgi:hypothetical protein